MFGIKNALLVAAVAGIGAMAPAIASADQWTNDGGASAYAGTAIATGSLTLTAGATTTTCDVEATLSLSNPGGTAAGSVTSFVLGVAAGGSCSSTIPGCTTVSASASSLPWGIATSGMDATISGVNFTNSYSGLGCPLNGVPVNATGSVTGTSASGQIQLSNAGPLTTTLGTATVDGDLDVTDTSGNPIELL